MKSKTIIKSNINIKVYPEKDVDYAIPALIIKPKKVEHPKETNSLVEKIIVATPNVLNCISQHGIFQTPSQCTYKKAMQPFNINAAFFNNTHKSATNFPATYKQIWVQTQSTSQIHKAKALLRDYVKSDCIFGSFLGRIFSGHWNRHHVNEVHQLLTVPYESIDELIFDLKNINPRKGGSLDKRINFIESQLNNSLEKAYSTMY